MSIKYVTPAGVSLDEKNKINTIHGNLSSNRYTGSRDFFLKEGSREFARQE
jgi:hypothetical protein